MTDTFLFVAAGVLVAALMCRHLPVAVGVPRLACARFATRICASGLCVLFFCSAAQAQEDEAGGEIFAFNVEAINEGLPPSEAPLRIDTPRAALESFLGAIRQDDFRRASHVLNLDAVPVEQQAERGPELALKLAYILRRHDLIDWGEVSDQPDARVLPDMQQPTAPYTRRSVELGEVDVDGRPIPISLQRFQTEEGEAVWLFSPYAVERVEEIYAEIRPGLLSRWIPLEERLDTLGKPSLVEWVAAIVVLLATGLIWLVFYYSTRALASRLSPIRSRAIRKIAPPFATLVAAICLRTGINNLVLLTGPIASELDLGSEAIGLAAGAWLLIQIVSATTLSLSERYVVPLAADDPENRRTKTTVYVIRRMALVVVALLSIGYILLRVGLFESFGVSVLASAGALGVLVAIAARPLLGNMVAGLQIALTDPVRIGDVVLYNGTWATVEDISFAHTVLRTWTETRLIVPHAEFISTPFENWSKDGEAVRRIVKIPVDYRIDMDAVRRKVDEILEGDPRMTGEPPLVEVVEVTAETAVLWIWLTGTTAFTSWYLHNDVREKVLAFLRDFDDGAFLPRRRHVLMRDHHDDPTAAPMKPTVSDM